MKAKELIKKNVAMQAEELRKKDVNELKEELIKLLKEHLDLRISHRSEQLKDFTKLGKVRKSIARIKTVIKEKQ